MPASAGRRTLSPRIECTISRPSQKVAAAGPTRMSALGLQGTISTCNKDGPVEGFACNILVSRACHGATLHRQQNVTCWFELIAKISRRFLAVVIQLTRSLVLLQSKTSRAEQHDRGALAPGRSGIIQI